MTGHFPLNEIPTTWVEQQRGRLDLDRLWTSNGRDNNI